jgi:hypothetical protein
LSTKCFRSVCAAGEAFVDAVPVVDIVLIHAPAEIDFFAAEQRGEIDQADVEILHQNAEVFDALHGVFQRLGVGIVLRFPRLGRGGIHIDAAHHQNALHEILNGLLGFLIARLRLHRFADAAAHHRQARELPRA